LGNLIKNALEASTRGETVTVKSEKKGDAYVCFKVHNPAVMPENVQLQIFNRSFTTKGVGRGLGTYSVKLLTTRYLKGSVSFISNKESGTTFEISLPLNLQSISDPKPTDS
jgi:signal transduction histidine kinase